MGRRPLGEKAMTNAERQRRWRERHRNFRKASTSVKFRRALYHLLLWFEHFLSPKEIEETFDNFGVAWRQDRWWEQEGAKWWDEEWRYTPAGQSYLEKFPDYDPYSDHEPWMDRVYYGEAVMGNLGDVLGDEARYQREREEAAKRKAERETEYDAWMEELRAEHGDDKIKISTAIIARLVGQMAA